MSYLMRTCAVGRSSFDPICERCVDTSPQPSCIFYAMRWCCPVVSAAEPSQAFSYDCNGRERERGREGILHARVRCGGEEGGRKMLAWL